MAHGPWDPEPEEPPRGDAGSPLLGLLVIIVFCGIFWTLVFSL